MNTTLMYHDLFKLILLLCFYTSLSLRVTLGFIWSRVSGHLVKISPIVTLSTLTQTSGFFSRLTVACCGHKHDKVRANQKQ